MPSAHASRSSSPIGIEDSKTDGFGNALRSSTRPITVRAVQVYVLFRRYFHAAKAPAYARASISHQPLKAKHVVELFEVWIKCYEVRAAHKRFAASFIREPDQRTLAEVYFHTSHTRQSNRRRVHAENRNSASLGFSNRAIKIGRMHRAGTAKAMRRVEAV